MEYISDEEILIYKALDLPIDKKVIQWAYQKLLEGYETDNLLMLAAELTPLDQIEIKNLLTNVLKDLKFDFSDSAKIIRNYLCVLIDKFLKDKKKH